MSIASRITSIENHIEEAYTEISRLGVDLTNVDKNIDNIADKLQEAYSQSPKVTDEGSNLSLSPTRKGGLTIISKGACEQDTITGKNIANTSNLSAYTHNGVTFTPVYENNLLQYINVNGKATGGVAYWDFLGRNVFSAGNYIVNGCPANGSSSSYRLIYMSYTGGYYSVGIDEGSGASVTADGTSEYGLRIRIAEGYTANNLKFYPMIRLSSVTDGTYEPYTGGIPSPNPDYPQDIRVVTDNLPVEYQEVEYLQFDGQGTFINTGVNLNANTRNIKIQTKIEVTDSRQDVNIFNVIIPSASSATPYKYYGMSAYSNKFYFGSNGDEQNAGIYSPTIGTQYTIIFNDEGKVIVNDDILYENVDGRVPWEVPLYIGMRGYSSLRYSWFKYFYFKVWDNGVIIRNMIPCYRKSDNVAGMYDLVNNVFYTNNGTGTFIVGNDVNNNSFLVQNKNIFKPHIPNSKYQATVTLSDDEFTIVPSATNAYVGEITAQGQAYNSSRGLLIDIPSGATKLYLYITNSIFNRNYVTWFNENRISLGYNLLASNNGNLSIPNNAKYFQLRWGADPYEVGTSYTLKIDVEISSITEYTKHAEQTLPLHLGTNYLAGIGNYDDGFVGKTDNWKIVRKIAKTLFKPTNGSLEQNGIRFSGDVKIPTPLEGYGQLYCNYFRRGKSYNDTMSGTNKINGNNTGQVLCGISGYTTVQEYLDFFNNYDVLLYTILATPVEIPITDTTLITDLNNMYQAMGYDGTTNITITSDTSNAQMTASVSALKGE